jgi:hypothetical protein
MFPAPSPPGTPFPASQPEPESTKAFDAAGTCLLMFRMLLAENLAAP